MVIELSAATTGKDRLNRALRISIWPMWTMPSKVLTSVLIVEATAFILVVLTIPQGTVPRLLDFGLTGILMGLGVLHTEITTRVERARRQVAGAVHVDLTSVWTFAAALLLPPALAAGMVAVVRGHLWRRAWHPRVPLYRQVFSIATIVLACLAAHTVFDAVIYSSAIGGITAPAGPSQLIGIGIAVLVYTTINSGLVAGAIAMSSPQPNLSDAIGEWEGNLLEVATLCLGGLTAIVLNIQPFLAAFSLPAVLCLNRAVLVNQLREAASIDRKTGLLNAVSWRNKAEQRLLRQGLKDRPSAVLVLDLDHFKAINDTYGHVAGDHVLAAVAGGLRSEVRDRDIVGRFGGEEFVVFLSVADPATTAGLHRLAERLRQRVADLRVEMPSPDGPLTIAGISVSIGAAVYPDHGSDIEDLLQVADTALYAAKRAGRNVVRMGHRPAISPSAHPAVSPTDSPA